ncbi:MAG: chorismate-binding protein, partial [Woeseiaceae bacterium]|nr:chorismate-binding protein [Woeseiaceae bacterium]
MAGLDDSVDLRALQRHAPDRYPFLLQSTAAAPTRGRYDILFACPRQSIVLRKQQFDFLDELDRQWRAERVNAAPSALPFTGGWFLYLGYELAAQVEPSLKLRDDPLLPTAFAVRCPAAILRDNVSGTFSLVAETPQQSDAVRADIAAVRGQDDPPAAGQQRPAALEDDPEQFLRAVRRARDYIAAGDIYQANLSRNWTVRCGDGISAHDVYAALCAANPAPFAGLVHWENTTIISSSPERLLRIRDGVASTRPIAGTRPRSDDRSIDDSLSAELFAHPKERAEHVMLIDLERNDLGRICEAGSVRVDEMMVLESYAHVHHIVSNIEGRLRPDVTPGEAIRAVFPGGTITGCPKVRCMQIIDELESAPRGAYTG